MSTPLRYLVEIQRPNTGWLDIQSVASRVRHAAEQLTAEGIPIRFLRSIFVPDDESCFFLFQSEGPEQVRQAMSRAAIEPRAFVETVSDRDLASTPNEEPNAGRSTIRPVSGRRRRSNEGGP